MPVMIFPARSKDFYFAPNTGVEYANFWDELWRQADVALRSAARVVICGYSLNPVDDRARKLLLEVPQKNAQIVVASGEGEGTGSTSWVVGEFQKAGYSRAIPAEESLFQNWVARVSNSVATTR